MKFDKTSVWQTDTALQLSDVLVEISNNTDMQSFLRDVLTEKEIIEISSRLQAANMLKNGNKYSEIIKKTKLSSRTIARIRDWMQNGCNGYSVALGIIDNHHSHV